jgi:hypothetical protein
LPHIELTSFIDANNPKSVILIAPGPTLSQIDANAAYDLAIFVGDSFKRTGYRAKSNAYMRANTEYPRLDVDAHVEDLGDFEGDLIFASSVMESTESVSSLGEKALGHRDFFIFDQRHFGGSSCSHPGPCCEHALEVTIQEQLAESIGIEHHYSEGATVLAHALALAILLSPTQIDIIGADIPLKKISHIYADLELEMVPRELNRGRIAAAYNTLVARLRIAINLSPKNTLRVVRRHIALLLLGSQSPSVMAEDFIELLTDFQYLSDAAAFRGIRLRANGQHSLFRRIPGYRAFE